MEYVCKPKEEGGLGLRNLEEANKVSCLKLIWPILSSKSSLWIQWIHKYLIRQGSFWSIKETNSSGSWIWKKLLKLRPLARDLSKMEVNNVETVENTYRRRRLRNPVLKQIESEILNLQELGLSQSDDNCRWMRENGEFRTEFLTSQTWNLIRVHAPRVSWFKGIWFKESTPKFSFLSWLAVHERLSTGDRLLKWNPQANSICWLCNTAMETRDHLFFECSFSAEVWRGTIRGLDGVSPSVHWPALIRRLVTGSSDLLHTFLLRYCFQAALYAIWFERNKRRVGKAPQAATRLIIFLDRLIRNRISFLRKKAGNKYEKTMEIWFGSR
ncbi:uncharacterized protein LOC106448254 [Brassica napus]|uniref:uncharacterized protein LOC106448254 n=1 Tax=Brassica napus TaxID=3708 RepID=UPI0006AACE81|nr:uncharacterized protein LOC106448254 [Brassica napus]